MKRLNFLLLLIFVSISACYKPSDYDAKPIDVNTIEIMPKRASIYANGADIDTIVVLVPGYADPGRRKVTLKTSAGVFVDSGNDTFIVSADYEDGKYPGKRFGEALLSGGLQAGNAKISGTVQNMLATTTITLKMDSAKAIRVEADKFYLTNFGEATITSSISGTKSGRGKPTAGQKVFFSAATDSLGKRVIGAFRGVSGQTNDKGTASAIYSCDSTYQGEVYIFAKILNNVKDTVVSKFKLYKTKL